MTAPAAEQPFLVITNRQVYDKLTQVAEQLDKLTPLATQLPALEARVRAVELKLAAWAGGAGLVGTVVGTLLGRAT